MEQDGVTELEQLYLDFARAVLDGAPAWAQATPPPIGVRREADYGAFLREHIPEMSRMPEAERYVQAHLASGTIPPPQLVDGITQEPITPSAVQVVDALLRSYVVESLRDLLAERRPFERGQGFALATAELLASYRRSLAMRTGPATMTIPLLGVTGNIQEPHPLAEQVPSARTLKRTSIPFRRRPQLRRSLTPQQPCHLPYRDGPTLIIQQTTAQTAWRTPPRAGTAPAAPRSTTLLRCESRSACSTGGDTR
jgi:hypothetical protein